MNRALLAAAVAAPVAALAAASAQVGQVVEVDRYSAETASSYINAAHCAGTAPLRLEWSIAPLGDADPASLALHRIYASSMRPTVGDAGSASFCAELSDANTGLRAGQVATFVATSTVQRGDVPAAAVLSAIGATCTSASEATVAYVCSHGFDGSGVRVGRASGSFIVQLAAPEAPAGVAVAGAAGSLEVTWTQSPGDGVAVDHYVVEATPADPDTGAPLAGAAPVSSAAVNGTTARISDLAGGQRYRVVVIAYSVGGNPSAASSPAFGTPAPVGKAPRFDIAWGGGGKGGCAAGGAGPLALLAVAGLLRALRGRPRPTSGAAP